MSQDLYKLGQSNQQSIENVGEEIRLDVNLSKDPFLNTGTITGVVTDENNNPVEGALVKILDNAHNPLWHTITDNTGSYNIKVAPGSEYHLHTIKQGYLLNEEMSFSIVAGQTIIINSKMLKDPNATLSTIAGHVNDAEEKPVNNLVVTLIKVVEGEESTVSVTTTNEYGQYVFMNVELASYIVRITGKGYKTNEVAVDITEESSIVSVNTTVNISEVDSKGTINGIIKDEDENPVVGAMVILYEVTIEDKEQILTPIRYTRTIEGGVYLFGDVPKGKYLVKANKEQ